MRRVAGQIPGLDLSDPSLQFANHYRNLQFGWDAAEILAKAHCKFPPVQAGEYFWRAYLYHCDARTYADEDILGAILLKSPRHARRREVLDSLLVIPGMTLEEAARQLCLQPGAAAAYEQLFFNVMDRQVDAMVLAELVYPETRLVEMMEGYMQNEALGKVLMRAGYNNGAADVLYFAGMHNGLIQGLAKADSPQRLEALVMGAGYLMARNNLLQPYGMFHTAKGLLNSAKQSGAASGAESPFANASMADAFMGEVTKAKLREAEAWAKNHAGYQKMAQARVIEEPSDA